MNAMPRCILLAVIVVGSVSPVRSQGTPEEAHTEILELLELSGANQMLDQMMILLISGMGEMVQTMRPDLPEDGWTIAEAALVEVFEENKGELMDRMAAVYARHFTTDEIRELNSFYRTPIGRKLVSKLPETMAEGAAVGRAWAESMAPEVEQEVDRRLNAAGY